MFYTVLEDTFKNNSFLRKEFEFERLSAQLESFLIEEIKLGALYLSKVCIQC